MWLFYVQTIKILPLLDNGWYSYILTNYCLDDKFNKNKEMKFVWIPS